MEMTAQHQCLRLPMHGAYVQLLQPLPSCAHGLPMNAVVHRKWWPLTCQHKLNMPALSKQDAHLFVIFDTSSTSHVLYDGARKQPKVDDLSTS